MCFTFPDLSNERNRSNKRDNSDCVTAVGREGGKVGKSECLYWREIMNQGGLTPGFRLRLLGFWVLDLHPVSASSSSSSSGRRFDMEDPMAEAGQRSGQAVKK